MSVVFDDHHIKHNDGGSRIPFITANTPPEILTKKTLDYFTSVDRRHAL